MIKKLMLAIISFSFISGCASLPDQIKRKDGRSLVYGSKNDGHNVLIRTVNGGEVLWYKNYTLSAQAWLEPGAHKIGVMCEFLFPWGKVLVPSKEEISINIETGKKYRLSGELIDGEKSNCVVSVNAI